MESTARARDARDSGLIPGLGRCPGVRNGNPVFLPGKFHAQRSLVGSYPWGGKEQDTTEHTHTQTHSHIALDNKTVLFSGTYQVILLPVVSLYHVTELSLFEL